MSIYSFFNDLGTLFEDRQPLTQSGLDALAASGHLKFEKNLNLRESVALACHVQTGDVGSDRLADGSVVYFDRHAFENYQLARPVNAQGRFWFTEHRNLDQILADTLTPVSAPVPTQTRLRLVS